jgi:hypothetical protein
MGPCWIDPLSFSYIIFYLYSYGYTGRMNLKVSTGEACASHYLPLRNFVFLSIVCFFAIFFGFIRHNMLVLLRFLLDGAAGNKKIFLAVAVLFVICLTAISLYENTQSIRKVISTNQQHAPFIFSTSLKSKGNTNKECFDNGNVCPAHTCYQEFKTEFRPFI